MSCDNLISVLISENVAFDDVDALNRDLRESSAGELASRILDGDYDIVRFTGETLLFIDADEIEYYEHTPDDPDIIGCYCGCVNVWSCWGLNDSQIIANHMTSGELVLRFRPEGCTPKYHRLVPGAATKERPSKYIDLDAEIDEDEEW